MNSDQLTKAVAKRLQHYLVTRRREEAFDPSGNYVPWKDTNQQSSGSIDSRNASCNSSVKDSVKKKTTNNMRGLEGLSEREKVIRKQIERSMLSQSQKKRIKSPYSVALSRMRTGYVTTDEYPRTKRKRRRSGSLTVGRPSSAVHRPSPSQQVTKEERDRILSIATKLIVATETVALPQNRRIAKGNQTDTEQSFPHLNKNSRRQSSASDPGPRNIPHPPAEPSRSSSGRGTSAATSPWGKSAWGENQPSGSGNDSHDEMQTQMQRLRIQERKNFILASKNGSRPRRLNMSATAVQPTQGGAKPRHRENASRNEAEIQTTSKANDNDLDDYDDDFYDHSSTEVSPMSTPRNIWSPSASVNTHDMSTQTVVHTGTQTTDNNGTSNQFGSIPDLERHSSLKSNRFKTGTVGADKVATMATTGTATEIGQTTLEGPTAQSIDQATDTVVPVETQTRRRDLEPTVLTYEVYVATGDKLGASTSAEVKITVFGEYGDSGERALLRSKTNANPFQRKQIDIFAVDSIYVGKLTSLRIGHNGTSLGTGWYLNSVFVKEGPEATRAFEFTCGRWLSARDDDGQIVRDLPLSRVIPAIDIPTSSGGHKEKTYFNYKRLSLDLTEKKRPLSGPSRPLKNGEANSHEKAVSSRPSTAVLSRRLTNSASSVSSNRRMHGNSSVADRRESTRDLRGKKPEQKPISRVSTNASNDLWNDANRPQTQAMPSERVENGVRISFEQENKNSSHSSDQSDEEEPQRHGASDVDDEPENVNDPDHTSDDRESLKGISSPGSSSDEEETPAPPRISSQSSPVPTETRSKYVSKTSSSSSSSSDEEDTKEENNEDNDENRVIQKSTENTKPEQVKEDETITVKSAKPTNTADLRLNDDSTLHKEIEKDETRKKKEKGKDETRKKKEIEKDETSKKKEIEKDETRKEDKENSPRQDKSDSSDDEKIEFSNNDSSKKVLTSGKSTPEEEYLAGFKAGLKASQEEQKLKEKEAIPQSPPPTVAAGDTIHHACEVGDTDKVKQMIMASPDLKNLLDERGWSPIHITASQGHLELMKWLSVCGVDLMKETPTGYTPMHVAAMNGHVNCLMILAAMGCSLGCKTVDNFTPLHLGAMSGHLECVKWLLANRAKHDVLDIHGRTPYDLADEYQHDDCANVLRTLRKDLKKKDSIINLLRNPVQPPSPRQGDNTGQDDDNISWVSDTEESFSAPDSRPGSGRTSHLRQERMEEEKEEKKRVYQKQREKLKKRGSSFLDSVRMDVENSVEDDF